jgi:hypothetical protein
MPMLGPHGQLLYFAHEAYNAIGRKRYVHEWTERFSGKAPVPHLPSIRKRAEADPNLPADFREFLQADPEDAQRAQIESRREDEVFKYLVNALEWHKADGWIREPNWRLVPCEEWQEGTVTRSELRMLLSTDIAAVLRDGRPAPRRILIDKTGLDVNWLGLVPSIDQPCALVPPEPKPAHRPGIDLNAFQREFSRRCRDGEVDLELQGWRLREAERLRGWYAQTHPGTKHVPEADTIRRRLKPEFDKFEEGEADKVPYKVNDQH